MAARPRGKAAGALRVSVAMARVAPTEGAVVLRVALAAAEVALAAKGGARCGDVGHACGHTTRCAAASGDAAFIGKDLERRAHGPRAVGRRRLGQRFRSASCRAGIVLWRMLLSVIDDLSFHILFCLFLARVGLCPRTNGARARTPTGTATRRFVPSRRSRARVASPMSAPLFLPSPPLPQKPSSVPRATVSPASFSFRSTHGVASTGSGGATTRSAGLCALGRSARQYTV